MERKEFLSMMGGSAAVGMLLVCTACNKSGDQGTQPVPGPTGVDFTLDLTLPVNSRLTTNGGYLVSGGVLVARNSQGNYLAVQQSCTHQDYPLQYQANFKRFYCGNHGSTFSESGLVQAAPASRDLTVYHTSLTGTNLRVFS